MNDNMNVFERLRRLRNGETIPSGDPEAYQIREASYATKKLLVQMNNSADPTEIRNLLGQITNSEIDESVAVFTPLHINYGKHTKIGKNVFINFDCVFLDLGPKGLPEKIEGNNPSLQRNEYADFDVHQRGLSEAMPLIRGEKAHSRYLSEDA